ncbi:serine/threonine-protein kinase, partial [Thermococcus zilligii]|uniref:serine/threonine-protein kinase n=1 Tax=Thermococcus zilligii TaxID=54076 RepID=UPI00029AED42
DIIVAGSTWSFGAGGYDVWVLRLDKEGNIKWQKTYGGSDDDVAYAVALADNRDIIVAGVTKSFGAGEEDIWVLLLPPDGNLPGCHFCSDSTAQVSNSDAEVYDTKCKVSSTAKVKVGDSEARVDIITPSVETQCYATKSLEDMKNDLSSALDIPPSLALTEGVEASMKLTLTNDVTNSLKAVLDFSENDFLELEEAKLEFPKLEKGKRVTKTLTVKPKYAGSFNLRIKINAVADGIKLEAEKVIPVEVAEKTTTLQTPATLTPTPAGLQLPPEFPPQLAHKYTEVELIGKGGFANVYKAKRRDDGKIVALKIPHIDEKTSKTFIREVSTWLHLDHPNIVRLYDADILPVPYLEMEYVEGVKVNGETVKDLDRYPKPVDEKTALKLIRGIAEGLKHAHSKGIYHRDLKPLNVLLKSDLTPKITDWGLAKLSTASSSRSVMGYTPLYAAPEHLVPGKYGHTDARTDIWQLGVTFYELLTGKLPFGGYTYEEVFGKIADESYKFTPPSRINPELAKYDGIFEKLLAKRKEDRYQSVDEFLKDLEKLEESERKKAELEAEVEKLKKSLSESVNALRKSTSVEEIIRSRRLVVETLGKLALAYAELNRKADLLNTLNDLKFYTLQNLGDLSNAIGTVELMIKEGIAISGEFIERLKVLVHSIQRENGA